MLGLFSERLIIGGNTKTLNSSEQLTVTDHALIFGRANYRKDYFWEGLFFIFLNFILLYFIIIVFFLEGGGGDLLSELYGISSKFLSNNKLRVIKLSSIVRRIRI